jgi:hypothetical protein
MIDLSNLGSLGDLAKQMEEAYNTGTDAMNQAGEQVAEDMNPDHQIEVSCQLDAKVEGHVYSVDADIIFEIELNPILQAANSPGGDLSSLLDGLDVDLGDDKEAVMEQLGQPRALGVVKKIKTKKLEISDKKGKASAELNKKASILATIKNQEIMFNFEGVFSYPENTEVFIAIPSMEKMQKNIVVDLDKIDKKVEFNWTEKDKDNLSVRGTLKLSKI